MSLLSKVRSSFNLKRDLPDLAGGIVRIGAESILDAHGVNAVEAKELSFIAGALTRDMIETSREAREGRSNQKAILKVSHPSDPSVTPCSFVYAMPVRQHRVQPAVAAVAPQIWLNSQAAWIYAEHMAYTDMGIDRPPLLLMGDESQVNAEDDTVTRAAWEVWRHNRKDNTQSLKAAVPFGSYVLGEVPDHGVIAWRSMLTPKGVRIGVLSKRSDCSIEDAPLVFESEDDAREDLRARDLSAPVDVLYLPTSLVAELQSNEVGALTRVQPQPKIWAGDPVTVKVMPRIDRDPDPVLMHPDWYVSEHDGSYLAWKPVGPSQVSFARVRRPDGTWGTAVWPSASKCLKDLGKVGEFGQQHPTVTIEPSLAPKVSQDLSL